MKLHHGLVALLFCSAAIGAELKQATVNAWNAYIHNVEASNRERLGPGHLFLWTDELESRRRRVRSGETVVAPTKPQTPKRVSGGLIHDWIGAAFIPAASLSEVLAVVRDYGRYQEYYRPNVIESKRIRQDNSEDEFSMLLMNKAFFLKTALDSEYRSSYVQLDAQRCYSVTQTTRVQEIENYDGPVPHRRAPDEGNGYIWRLYSIARFEQRDGGVYVEIEAIALSRDIPLSIRWMVDPIVRRVSKASLYTSLQETQDAVTGTVVNAFSPALRPATPGVNSFH